MLHGVGCNAKTYRTRCKFCGGAAFFFTCDCGCRVFFEALGEPWTKHDCPEYAQYLQILDTIAANEGRIAQLEQEYKRAVADWARTVRQAPILRASAAGGAFVRDVGVVRDVEEDVDVYRRAGVQRGAPMAAHFLGALAKAKHAQVTIHCGELGAAQLNSFTLLVEATLWSKVKAASGDLLSFAARGETLATGYTYWRCTELGWPL